MSEGSVWEAMAFASYYQLDNLVAILDINRLGQSDPAPLQHHVEKYQRRCEAFGWAEGGSAWVPVWFFREYDINQRNSPVGLHVISAPSRVIRWQSIIVDGHSVEELCKVLSQPRHQPFAIIAKTIKGKGIPGN